MTQIIRLVALAFAMLSFAGTGQADEASVRSIIAKFAEAKKFSQTQAVIEELSGTGDALAIPALKSLARGSLWTLKSDRAVVIATKTAGGYQLRDPINGQELQIVQKSELRKIKIKNSIRRLISGVLSGLTLRSPDPVARLKAARTIFLTSDASALEALSRAMDAEQVSSIRTAMAEARASAILKSDRASAEKRDAIGVLAGLGNREALSLLIGFRTTSADTELQLAADAAIARINKNLTYWDAAQNIVYGLSLGSVLLLAAIGLAITFGVMGVINMAHGEMVMIGAYTTFVVQEVIRDSFPHLFDWSLLMALPLAFLVAGAVGLAMERSVIRFLYGRPLETLLATWGVSLVLQQTVRTIFGPTNREVGNPAWMSGAYELGGLTITASRLWIIVFAMIVFAILLVVLRRTAFGLQMRAVTQNRAMASSMGIRTPWIDALTFALGSGIAGIAGVALSQITNVSPNLGKDFIIDSFMVVVFGGVGNLWGTFVAAMSLGVANKFLEPFAGAVLAKIAILVFIILFIQKQPRGLFALKGRAVEA